jgi:hypothetical protein
MVWYYDAQGPCPDYGLCGRREIPGVRLARTWESGRKCERQLKNKGGASRICPVCGITPATWCTPGAGG